MSGEPYGEDQPLRAGTPLPGSDASNAAVEGQRSGDNPGRDRLYALRSAQNGPGWFRRFWDEAKRPYSIVTTLLAIVGLGLSWWFYYLGIQAAEIAYDVDQVQVFDIARASSEANGGSGPPLTVLDSQGHPINESIYAADIAVWNSGNAEAKREDVRIPLAVAIQGKARVIDAVRSYPSDKDNIDEFSIRPIAAGGAQIQINWRHFDPSAGLRVRVLYASQVQQEILLIGKVLGIASFNNIPRARARYSAMEGGYFVVMGLIVLSSSVFFWIRRRRIHRAFNRDPESISGDLDFLTLVNFYVPIFLVGLGLWYFWGGGTRNFLPAPF
jgi:hypothetical protein